MKLDIEPKQIERMAGERASCIEDDIATIASYFGLEYKLMFMRSWDFRIKLSNSLEDKLVGDKLFSDRYNEYLLLEKYHGISINFKKVDGISSVLDKIKHYICLGKPVIVNFDSYYCPWDKLYNISHNSHACIIVGFEEDSDIIYMTDPYFLKKIKEVRVQQLDMGCSYYATIDFDEDYKYNPSVKDILRDTISNLYYENRESSAFQDMEKFLDILEEKFDPQIEFSKYDNFVDSRLFHNISECILKRNYFYIGIKYLYKITNDHKLNDLMNDAMKMISEWNIICSLFAKTFYKKNYRSSLESICYRIRKVREFEESICLKINCIIEEYDYNQKIYKSTTYYNKSEDIINGDEKIIEKVSLKAYFNNKAFGKYETNCTSDLTGLGEYLLIDESNIKDILSVKDMEFSFPILECKLNDNISCSNQLLHVKSSKNCSKIMILCCGEWGSFYEKLIIKYEDDIYEELYIYATDLSCVSFFDEEVAWSGKTVQRSEEGLTIIQNNAKIFAKSYNLKIGGQIRSILLPDCSNIHIFAISIN